MGGRGSSSASLRAKSARIVAALRERQSAGGSSPRRSSAARMAGAAADLIEQGRASGLLGSNRLNRIASEMGKSGVSVTPGKLEDSIKGGNVPLGMDRFDWHYIGAQVINLNNAGYSNDEIAAAIRFDRQIREAIGWR